MNVISLRIITCSLMAGVAIGGSSVLAQSGNLSGVAGIPFPISNHDQSPVHEVEMALVGVTNRVVDMHGAQMRIRPGRIAVLVKDSVNVTIRNLVIDAVRPALTECRVIGFEKGETVVEIDEARYPVELRDGKLRMVGSGMDEGIRLAKIFDGVTHEMTARSGDTLYDGTAVRVRPGVYRLKRDFSKCGAGAKVGDVIAFRPRWRRCPAMVVTGAKDVRFEDVIVHDCEGMALIAQCSENVSWRGTRTAQDKTSGVFPSAGRYSSAHADATHFSNVRGRIVVENCWFEGMMDDAINVHSTCLKIIGIEGRNVRCRFMHHQAVGLPLFEPGNLLRFIRPRTFENGPTVPVSAVERCSDTEIVVTLDGDVPAGFAVGDAVEDATLQATETVFRNNIVRNNRARGSLFSTPGRVLVESNVFDHVSGTAVLMPGDVNKWYESGSCEDVTVKGNVFRDCLATTTHGHSLAVITIDPSVPEPENQKVKYHRNITVCDNVFETFGTTLLFARSVDGIVWKRNKVVRNSNYPAWNKPDFVITNCVNVTGIPGAAAAAGTPDYVSGDYADVRERAANTLRYSYSPNRMFEKIRDGKPALGGYIGLTDPQVCEVAGMAGLDFVWIDMEHRPMTVSDLKMMQIALEGTGCASLIRVCSEDFNHVKPIVDIGVDGIIFPQISGYDAAVKAVEACRYPQAGGKRGICVSRQSGYGRLCLSDYLKRSETWPIIIIEIEDMRGMKDLDRILTLKDVDGIMVGPSDLACSMGALNKASSAEMQALLDDVAEWVHKAGKLFFNIGTAESSIRRKSDFICGPDDIGTVSSSWKRFIDRMK